MLTEDQLWEWEILAGAATAPPWTQECLDADSDCWQVPEPLVSVASDGDYLNLENATFIVASREAVPQLIAEVRRLREVSVVALMKVRALKDEVERLAPYLKPTDARSSGASKHPL